MITFTWLNSPWLLYPAAIYGMAHAWSRLLDCFVLPDGRWRWKRTSRWRWERTSITD